MFQSRREGFAIRFKNGVMVSVMFGSGFACELGGELRYEEEFKESNSADAEVYLEYQKEPIVEDCPLFPEKKMEGEIYGHITPEELLLILVWARTLEDRRIKEAPKVGKFSRVTIARAIRRVKNGSITEA